jgi:hypothetical protein
MHGQQFFGGETLLFSSPKDCFELFFEICFSTSIKYKKIEKLVLN